MFDNENNNGYQSEDITEEILNKTFFQDFVFKGPKLKNKYQHENSDVFVCFDDVLLIVQIKKQCSKRSAEQWGKKNITKAVNQVTGAINSINKKKIEVLENSKIGNLKIDRDQYKLIYGLVIIDQESAPYSVAEYVKTSEDKYKTAIQIMSLNDFQHVCTIFSTAGEFFHYYDVRNAVGGSEKIKIHEETSFFSEFIDNFAKMSIKYITLKNDYSPSMDEQLVRVEQFYKDLFYGDKDNAYKYSSVFDGLIERMHKMDESTSEYIDKYSLKNAGTDYSAIAHELAKTHRLTRIYHGKEIFKRMDMVRKSPDKDPSFTIESRKRRTAYFYYFPLQQMVPEDIYDQIGCNCLNNLSEKNHVDISIGIAIQYNPREGERYFFSMIRRENLNKGVTQ